MAFASRILSKASQFCKFNVDTILPKDRLLPVRYFAKGDPSINGQALPYDRKYYPSRPLQPSSPKNDNKIYPDLIPLLSARFAEAGIDDEHWQIYPEPLSGSPKKDEIINYYIKILAQVLASEEEAVKKIYSVATRERYVFGANVSMEIADKIRDLTNVLFVVGDAYVDPIKKRYPWDPFVNGQALEYDPRYYLRVPERESCRCTLPSRLQGKTVEAMG
ncbi:multiple organellar RNA editing factor 3, mitochondrial-like [Silene latifolia]|uniref:multiple organellar RNA editing factor 3, mitochondrial-like n=1 Tax=Silene latifolia TaxID=37657 RepID=UPI003D76CA8B